MSDENENINMDAVPSYKFKPIDFNDDHAVSIEDSILVVVQDLRQLVPAAQEQQHEPHLVGAEMIFREVLDNNSSGTGSGLLVRRANPVGSYGTVEDDLDSSCRVISPYPFSHTTGTSQEETEDRDQLAGAFDWDLQADPDLQQLQAGERVFEMDYAQFFDMMDGMDVDSIGSPDDTTDDFSVASNVSYDLCLDRTDPTTFWNAGMNILTMKNDAQQRSDSPSQVSLDS